MSDEGRNGSQVGGYIVVALITAGIVYSCTKPDSRVQSLPIAAAPLAPQIPSTETVLPTPLPSSTFIPIEKPTHFYDSVEGSTYYYGMALSEDERKSGKRAPDMVAFWYLGRDSQGRDVLKNVTSGGSSGPTTCARPCKVIHRNDGSVVGFDSGSIIGAAFADAQHGFLKKHSLPKPKYVPEAEQDYPWPGDPVVPAPTSTASD